MNAGRRPRRRALGLALAVVALAAPACGGDSGADDEAASPSTTEATTTTTRAVAAVEPPPSSAATTPPTVAANRSLGGLVSGRAAPATTTTTVRAAAPGLRFTAPGVYRYTSTGTFTSTLGTAEPRDGETTLTVDPPVGADQHSVRRGPGRTTEQVLRSAADGHYLVSLRTTDLSLSKEVRPVPPVLAMPADPAPGRTWSWRTTSTDGRTTVESSFRARRTEEVAVGADRVNAVAVDVDIVASGDVTFTSRQTLWVSQPHRLVVRVEETTNGTLGGLITFSSTSTDRLRSLTPS